MSLFAFYSLYFSSTFEDIHRFKKNYWHFSIFSSLLSISLPVFTYAGFWTREGRVEKEAGFRAVSVVGM